jgi:hypothetical protein
MTIWKSVPQTRVITVPTITLEGDANGTLHPDGSLYAKKFSGKYAHGSSRAASDTICLKKPPGLCRSCRRSRRLLQMNHLLVRRSVVAAMLAVADAFVGC